MPGFRRDNSSTIVSRTEAALSRTSDPLIAPSISRIPGRSGVASRRRCYSRGRVTHRPGRLPPPPADALLVARGGHAMCPALFQHPPRARASEKRWQREETSPAKPTWPFSATSAATLTCHHREERGPATG